MKKNLQLKKWNLFLTLSLVITIVNLLKAQNCNYVAAYTYSVGANGTATLVSNSTGTNASSYYRWAISDVNSNTWLNSNGPIYISSNPTTFTFVNNGVYQVTLAVADSYSNIAYHICSDSIIFPITVNTASCSATTTFSLQKVTNQNFTWNGLVSYPSNVSTVNWNWGDGTSSNSMFPTHTYSAAGNYVICLTVTVSCGTVYSACTNTYLNRPSSDGASQIITVNIIKGPTTGLNSIENQEQNISIFPNPNNSNFSINLDGFEVGKEVELIVCNILGEEIYSEKFLIDSGKQTKELELSESKFGTYFVKLTEGNHVKVTKLLIVR